MDWSTHAGGGPSAQVEHSWSTVEELWAHTMAVRGEVPTTFAWLTTHCISVIEGMDVFLNFMAVSMSFIMVHGPTIKITMFPVLFVRLLQGQST